MSSFRSSTIVVLFVSILPLGLRRANAQCEIQEDTNLTASDAATADLFGASVSVNGNVAMVGAFHDDCSGGFDCGSAYVYRFNGSNWAQETKLSASDALPESAFGLAVSVNGNVAIIGALYHDCPAGVDCGAAYVYRYDGTNWIEEAKLSASDAAENDYFGVSVSVFGDVAIVGANHDDDNGSSSGSVYVYRYNGSSWGEESKLTASDGFPGDQFGNSVAISGNVAVVGAISADCTLGIECGAAYLFRYSGSSWVEEDKVVSPEASAHDAFAFSVSVSGEVVVVGEYGDDCASGGDCGAAYVYRFDGDSWVEETKLTASDAAQNDQFGRSVAVSEDMIVVGAINDGCTAGSDCGAAYLFRFNGDNWVQQARLSASDGAAGDELGYSVALSGMWALVGDYSHDCVADADCGSSYIFALRDCNTNGVPDECECLLVDGPLTEAPQITKNRYISLTPGSAGCRTALQVTMSDLPPPWNVWNGRTLWLGPPTEYTELSG